MAYKRLRSLLALAAAPVSVYSLDVLSPPTNSSEPAVSSLSSDISTSITSPDLPPPTTSQPSTPSDDIPSSIETPTITLPPSLASATTCLSSWSSWSSAVTAYTGPYSSGTYSLITPAVTLTGHLYYTTPAPSTYSPPEYTFADPSICAALASDGVQIIGSAPTTVVVPATTAVLEGDVPAEVLLPSPACSVGQAACSALASVGVVDGFWDGWVVDWRDCVMEPPGIGPVALTTTDFLVAPPTEVPATTTGRTTTGGGGRSGSSNSRRPTSTKTAEGTGGYLVSETELLPGMATGKPEDGKGGGGGVVAASQVVAATNAAQGPHTIDLIISAPNNNGAAAAPPSSTRLTLPPPPVITPTDPIPVATLAGQTIVFDPAKASSAVLYVGDFPIREGGPAVNVGGTPVRLLPGGMLLVGGGAGGKSGSPTTTIALPAAAATTDVPIATIAGMPVYADPARPGAVIVGGEALAPGASVVLDDGKTVWLGGGATGGLQLEQVAGTKVAGDGAGVAGWFCNSDEWEKWDSDDVKNDNSYDER
ncbi:hypothetical protein DIS24_g6866 [Lasiodiplodia hormozganensis]|uniref:Uncharacterized protein n=1 Tax=Lasiodiplodia hormozganensis TaxID=869390 RepID=A0AA39YD00_9PEZI|nr:hypothetical protein DIS24_g6866 [Lasiodiplodia hormozganensis]